jgi:hypothetical protein
MRTKGAATLGQAGGQGAGATVGSPSSTHPSEVADGPTGEGLAPAATVDHRRLLLNAGLSKRGADDATAGQLHGFAAGTYPFLGKLDARRFTGLLSTAEIAIGTALVVPVVPAWLAGAGLTAFALGTLGLYLRTPGMRQEGSLRPTQQGIPLAKDAWMVGIGLALMIDEVAGRASQS